MEPIVIDGLGSVFTTEVIILGIIVGFLSEVLKRLVRRSLSDVWTRSDTWQHAVMNTLLSLSPVLMGGLGALVLIPLDNGIAHSVAFGMVSGVLCTQIYATVSPTVKTLEAKIRKPDAT